MRELEVLGEYAVYLDYENEEAIVGHIHHVAHNETDGRCKVLSDASTRFSSQVTSFFGPIGQSICPKIGC